MESWLKIIYYLLYADVAKMEYHVNGGEGFHMSGRSIQFVLRVS